MNLTNFSKVAEDALQAGETYLLKTRWGEAYVIYRGSSVEGHEVEIESGGFNVPPKLQFRKGDSMVTGIGSGSWYQVKA
jgi:hypothetical protein